MCARTIYCTNIDKKVIFAKSLYLFKCVRRMTFYMFYMVYFEQVLQADVKLFFESVCGEVCDPIEA